MTTLKFVVVRYVDFQMQIHNMITGYKYDIRKILNKNTICKKKILQIWLEYTIIIEKLIKLISI